MNDDERRALRSRQGRELASFLTDATNPNASTSRRELEADLDAAGITDAETRDALVATYGALVKRARAGENTLELRQHANALAVDHLRKIRAADDLEGDHGIPETAADDGDADELAEQVRAKARGLTDEQYAEEKADRVERERLQRLGFRPG